MRKGWIVLTTCKSLWPSLHHRCPGHAEHCECSGQVAQASSYHPAKMVTAVVKAIGGHWQAVEVECGPSIADDVNSYSLDIRTLTRMRREVITHCQGVRDESPEIFALTRNRFPEQPPTVRKCQKARTDTSADDEDSSSFRSCSILTIAEAAC